MAIVQPGSGDIPEVEPGLYTFKIIKTKQDIRQDDTFGNAGEPVLEIHCELADIVDEEGEPIILRPIVNLKYSQGGKYQPSTLYLFAKAAGVAPREGQPFDTDLLEGRVLQGMVRQEEGKWPKIEPKSLMPVKAGKMGAHNAPTGHQDGADAPFDIIDRFARADGLTREQELTEAAALAAWFENVRSIGYTPKEINDHAAAAYDGRLAKDLTAIERGELAKSLGV